MTIRMPELVEADCAADVATPIDEMIADAISMVASAGLAMEGNTAVFHRGSSVLRCSGRLMKYVGTIRKGPAELEISMMDPPDVRHQSERIFDRLHHLRRALSAARPADPDGGALAKCVSRISAIAQTMGIGSCTVFVEHPHHDQPATMSVDAGPRGLLAIHPDLRALMVPTLVDAAAIHCTRFQGRAGPAHTIAYDSLGYEGPSFELTPVEVMRILADMPVPSTSKVLVSPSSQAVPA